MIASPFNNDLSVMFRYMGTITGIGDLDPVRWPNSHWRSVKVCHCKIIGIFLDVRTTLCACF